MPPAQELACDFRATSRATPGARDAIGWRWRAPAEPLVFDCPSVWRHPQPLLAVLRDEYGKRSFAELRGAYGWVIRYEYRRQFDALGIRTLGEYLDLFEAGTTADLPYLTHLSVHRNLAALRPWFLPPPEFGPNWVAGPALDRFGGPELFIGQRGTRFAAIHQDHAVVHVGFYQLLGEKTFTVFPPDDAPWLYTYRGREFPYQRRNSRVQWFAPDRDDRYPLLRNARPRTIVLRAGQALLLPANWWHATECLSDCVTWNIRIINHTNVVASLGAHLAGLPLALRRGLQRGV